MLYRLKNLIPSSYLSILSRQSLAYVLIKYIDLLFLTYLYFAFANLVGPINYGIASKGFIFISYSTLLILGLHQVFIRRYSLLESADKVHLSYYTLFYSGLVGALILIVAIIVIDEEYSYLIGLICFAKILQDATITINRAKEKAFFINITTISFSLIFTFFFILEVADAYDFFLYWSISALFSCGYGLYSIRELFNNRLNKRFYKYISTNISSLFKEGLVFSFYTVLFIAYSSTDRLFLLKVADKVYVGNYQLADNIATAVSAGLGALWYISMPKINSKLQNGLNYRRFVKVGTIVISAGLVCLVLILLPSIGISSLIFREYKFLSEPLFLLIIGKYMGVALSIPSAIYFALSKWHIYTKYFFWAVLFDSIFICLAAFNLKMDTLIYIFPIVHITINILFYWFICFQIFNDRNLSKSSLLV